MLKYKPTNSASYFSLSSFSSIS